MRSARKGDVSPEKSFERERSGDKEEKYALVADLGSSVGHANVGASVTVAKGRREGGQEKKAMLEA